MWKLKGEGDKAKQATGSHSTVRTTLAPMAHRTTAGAALNARSVSVLVFPSLIAAAVL